MCMSDGLLGSMEGGCPTTMGQKQQGSGLGLNYQNNKAPAEVEFSEEQCWTGTSQRSMEIFGR